MRLSTLPVFLLLALTTVAAAAGAEPAPPVPLSPVCAIAAETNGPWRVSFGPAATAPAVPLRLTDTDAQATAAPRRPVAIDYSDAYRVRARIHQFASFATLPIFGAMYYVGQDLYDNPGSESKKGLHGGLAATTGVLFGVNTLTGAWNLWEGRKDTNHRGRRMVHGILMMAADAGFVATGLLAPDDEDQTGLGASSNRRSTHRTVALTSMGVATASYLLMLFWGD